MKSPKFTLPNDFQVFGTVGHILSHAYSFGGVDFLFYVLISLIAHCLDVLRVVTDRQFIMSIGSVKQPIQDYMVR